jgi:hypothetical protein
MLELEVELELELELVFEVHARRVDAHVGEAAYKYLPLPTSCSRRELSYRVPVRRVESHEGGYRVEVRG